MNTSVVLPLGYYAEDGTKLKKIRCICLSDVFLKIAWRLFIVHIQEQDPKLFDRKNPSSYGVKNVIPMVFHAISSHLDQDHHVISLDAINAFPSLLRQASFDYFYRKPFIYAPFYHFLNFTYASHSNGKMFDKKGFCVLTVDTDSGIKQGCTSGPLIFHISLLPVLSRFTGKILAVVDDIHIFDISILDEVIAECR
ncbi:MAG: hypothetical protein AAB276_01095, partial [Pseudomonadota bacterium]